MTTDAFVDVVICAVMFVWLLMLFDAIGRF